eukprot:1428890-Prymnesium_polylepis.1
MAPSRCRRGLPTLARSTLSPAREGPTGQGSRHRRKCVDGPLRASRRPTLKCVEPTTRRAAEPPATQGTEASKVAEKN